MHKKEHSGEISHGDEEQKIKGKTILDISDKDFN